MSHDPSANLQIFSPTASGRSSPSPRVSRNTAEEALGKKDKSFRRYAAGVERALTLWDTAQQEWADYISFLGRLLKALQAHSLEKPVIPRSDAVALRLSQCLNPSLPSGVHQKALEVYAYIFSSIGKEALARDLNIYFPGLAPVPSFASLSVRPLFLSLLENYILNLDGAALRPALKAIILCLLPGLEDETSEDFERMVSALNRLRSAFKPEQDEIGESRSETGSSHFWQCFFLATITNASRRQGALAYLMRHLPRFGTAQRRGSAIEAQVNHTTPLPAEAEAAISPEPGLLIRAFESGLSDSNLLIQRGFLDLLVSHLPLDSPVLQSRITGKDLERLVAAAAGVVSRRDMSLNRRLWAWFLGPEPSSSADGTDSLASPTQDKNGPTDPSAYHAAYFSRFGLEPLSSSILRMINRPSRQPADRARPFRICLSLMDRWEVGGLIIPEIFLPALQSIQTYSETASREQVDEVLRSASNFFDGVESGLIWGKLTQLVTSALAPQGIEQVEASRRLRLAKFILSRFNLKEEEMMLHHMPLLIFSAVVSLNQLLDNAGQGSLQDMAVVDIAFEIIDSLVQIVPDRALRNEHSKATEAARAAFTSPREALLARVKTFYDEHQGNLDFADAPLSPSELGQIILREALHMFSSSLQEKSPASTHDMPSKILANIILKVGPSKILEEADLKTLFQHTLTQTVSTSVLPFQHLVSMTIILSALQSAKGADSSSCSSRLAEVIHPLAAALWEYLSPLKPKFHVEATRCFLQLQSISPTDRIVESAITSKMVSEIKLSKDMPAEAQSDSGRRFAVLWTHTMYEIGLQHERRGNMPRRSSGIGVSGLPVPIQEFQSILTRPLLILLDSLTEEGTELCAFMKDWLQDLPTLDKVLGVLADHLQNLHCLNSIETLMPSQEPQWPHRKTHAQDTHECLYFLRHLSAILSNGTPYTWGTLSETPAPVQIQPPGRKVFLQEWLVQTCLRTLSIEADAAKYSLSHLEDLHRTSVMILSQVYKSPFAAALRDLELEVPLMSRIRTATPSLQSLLLDALLSTLKIRLIRPPEETDPDLKTMQPQAHRSRLSLTMDRQSVEIEPAPIPPPPQLVDCLKFGFSNPSSRLVLDSWVAFLIEVLPLFADTIFQSLLPLVECLCKEIGKTFEQLKLTFSTSASTTDISPETTLISLINGLEQILAKAHDRLMMQETRSTAHKSPEQPQGFFGNMVSGVFASDPNHTRVPTANTRLTVLLCFQDTVRICFAIWTWGGYGSKDMRHDPASASSSAYTSLRMRNRARRILEHLFAAEALECLETLIVLWSRSSKDDTQTTAVMSLLNVLNGSKPKHTIPAIFNAVYSRTNPHALDLNRMSTLTSDLADTELVSFLVDYTKSLEDDAMDDIWVDCTVFLRDVLANPLPHRQVLPSLLEFTVIIAQKVDNTNIGEQRKMRKELADIFTRILTAVFTTRSMSFLQDASETTEKSSSLTNGEQSHKRAADVVTILTSIAPYLPIVLVENDRVMSVVTTISGNVVGPTFRAKAFPENVSSSILELLYQISRVAQANKFWKKDVSDAFNDPRFFATPVSLLETSWLPILAQWTHSDKGILPELLTRLSAPTTAGIMFGVGAASARQEADRRTQLTLRRISLLHLVAPEDTFTSNLPQVIEKMVELLTATPASSPSSATRAEVIILLRAIITKTSAVHLAPLWPIVNGELASGLSSLLPDAENKDSYNNASILQTCKLLDQLIVLDPDDFQLIEWLFISDTLDAVYKPADPTPIVSLTDEIADVLSHSETPTSYAKPPPLTHHQQPGSDEGEAKRTLFLDPLIEALEKEEDAEVLNMARSELLVRVVRPFLGQLGMLAFEATYGGGEADWDGVWGSVLGDAKGFE